MIKLEYEHWRTFVRRFWLSVFALVIGVAVCVQLGRQAFPLLQDYKDEITELISQRLGVSVKVNSINAEWSGLRPQLTLEDVVVDSDDGVRIFKVAELTAELSIFSSIFDWRAAWRQLSFSGLDTTLVQSYNGAWSLPGAPTAKNQEQKNFSFDDPYDVFLFGRRVTIRDARFELKYAEGDIAELFIPRIAIENDRDFHRISANLDIASERAFSLVIEGHGRPGAPNFIANGFVEFEKFPTTRIVDALALNSVLKVTKEHEINAQLWFRSDVNKGATIRGNIAASGEAHIVDQDLKLPTDLSSVISGKFQREQGWRLTFDDLQANWQEFSSPAIDVSLKGRLRELAAIYVNQLDLEAWVKVFTYMSSPDTESEYREILTSLNPKGKVRDLKLFFTSPEQGYFSASATIENASTDVFKGSPEVRNVSGKLRTSLLSGQLDLDVDDGVSFHLPKIYSDPIAFDEAKGTVSWSYDPDRKLIHIGSGLLTVGNPDETGKGYLNLAIPIAKKYGEPKMTLALGIENTLAERHKKYVPKTIPKLLYAWLGTSIKQGRITNAKFLYHGSLGRNASVKPSVQLSGEVYDGNLIFDPRWPELKNVTGSLMLENNELDVQIEKASLLGNSVYDAAIRLVDDPASSGQALSIEGSLASDAKSAMTLLKNSPVKQHIGSTFDQWIVSGGVSAKVALLIPLQSESSGFAYNIDVKFDDANIEIADLGLSFSNIAGDLYYQTHQGLFTDNLVGDLWGHSIESSIESPFNKLGSRDTKINFKGPIDIESLYAWVKRPELKFSAGTTNIEGNLLIPARKTMPLTISMTSDLSGIEIDLPEPLGKTAEQTKKLTSRLRFFDDAQEYQFRLADEVNVILLNKDKNISAEIELNKNIERREHRIAETGLFNITGSIDRFDLEKWTEVKDRYLRYSRNAFAEVDKSGGPQARFDIDINKFLLGTFEIDDLNIEGVRNTPYWELNVESELMAGKVRVPEDERPIQLDLDYLRLTSDEQDKVDSKDDLNNIERQSVLANIDLSRAVPLDFMTDNFYLNDVSYGAWDFKVRPEEQGILVHDIHARFKGMTVGGEKEGAKFLWINDESGHSSRFTGNIYTKNLADVFEAWGQEVLLESESASIAIDAQWPGAPDQVSLVNVEGRVAIDVEKGSFYKGAGNDENALLRLLALFNIDTIIRRLRLDFSDLASQGYAFDHIHGNFEFRDGSLLFSEPMIVESSSSYVQMAGTVDMVRERIDSDVVVTLPLAGGATFATAIVVNLPAAIGLYVMSKIFKKQVDKASTLSVEVKGKWEDPKIKVKKIFDTDAAVKRGEEVKQKNKIGDDSAAIEPYE